MVKPAAPANPRITGENKKLNLLEISQKNKSTEISHAFCEYDHPSRVSVAVCAAVFAENNELEIIHLLLLCSHT